MHAPWDQRINESDSDHRALMRWIEAGPLRALPSDPAAQVHNWAQRAQAYDIAHGAPQDPKVALLGAYQAFCQACWIEARKLLVRVTEDPTGLEPKDVRKMLEAAARIPALAQGLPTEQHVHLHGLSPEQEHQIADLFSQLAASGLIEEPRK